MESVTKINYDRLADRSAVAKNILASIIYEKGVMSAFIDEDNFVVATGTDGDNNHYTITVNPIIFEPGGWISFSVAANAINDIMEALKDSLLNWYSVKVCVHEDSADVGVEFNTKFDTNLLVNRILQKGHPVCCVRQRRYDNSRQLEGSAMYGSYTPNVKFVVFSVSIHYENGSDSVGKVDYMELYPDGESARCAVHHTLRCLRYRRERQWKTYEKELDAAYLKAVRWDGKSPLNIDLVVDEDSRGYPIIRTLHVVPFDKYRDADFDPV